jgi:hypothetical protein
MGQILLWCGFLEIVGGVPAMQSMLDGSGRCVNFHHEHKSRFPTVLSRLTYSHTTSTVFELQPDDLVSV